MNHYDSLRCDWQKRFLTMDPAVLLQKLPFLIRREDCLAVPYFDQVCTIRFEDGVVETTEKDTPLTLMDEMNIYTLLWYSRPEAKLTGQFVPFRQLRGASPYDPAFRRGNLEPIAATFSGQAEKLSGALRQLGGRCLPTGDVGYEIYVFPCLPVRVLFWDHDDEFPAQSNLLFDSSAADFIHVESIVSISSELLRRLARLASVPVLGAPVPSQF